MKTILKLLSEERFLIPLKIILVYAGWKLFHHFASMDGTVLHFFWTKIVFQIGTFYAAVTGFILALKMSVTSQGITINLLESHQQIWVEEHCLAIPAMVIFVGAIVFFKGSAKEKALFLPLGLLGIIAINILRLIFVSLAWVYLSKQFFNLHHTFIYAFATYGFIFLMIVWWVKRSEKQTASKKLLAQ